MSNTLKLSLQLSSELLAGGLLAHKFVHMAGESTLCLPPMLPAHQSFTAVLLWCLAGLQPTGQANLTQAGPAHDLAWPWPAASPAAAAGAGCSARTLHHLCQKLPLPPPGADPLAPLDAAARLAWMRAHPEMYHAQEDGAAVTSDCHVAQSPHDTPRMRYIHCSLARSCRVPHPAQQHDPAKLAGAQVQGLWWCGSAGAAGESSTACSLPPGESPA